MKTEEQIEKMLTQMEFYVAQGNPYYTTNVPRDEVTELITLVRDQQKELEQLRERALEICLTT